MPVNVQDLNSALNELRADIVSEGFSSGLVEEIAESYEILPELLARKFEEKHSRKPQDYKAISPDEIKALAIKRAKDRALDLLSAEFTGEGSSVEAGKLFSSNGEEFVSVCLARKSSRSRNVILYAVRVRDAERASGFRVFKDGYSAARRFNLI